MNEIRHIAGTGVPLFLDDIDTDRIIPARFLRCVTFDGLGEHVFEDDRAQAERHPFDDPRFSSGSVLVTGRNFGCGSSREHAPQALMRWGIQAIVGESFAEIFFGNCTSLGIPCLSARREDLAELASAVESTPETEITCDLVGKTVRWGETEFAVGIPDSARESLTTGQWDFLSQLVEGESETAAVAAELPYLRGF